VSALNFHTGEAIGKLESLFDRPRRASTDGFTDWEKDFAHVAQALLEETVVEIGREYCHESGIGSVGLAGGVALNCKMNKRIMELEAVDELFVQPVAHDAGSAIGAGLLASESARGEGMNSVYWGPAYSTEETRETLDDLKLDYSRPENLERDIAERLADGELVGWLQGRLEVGPRALGNRSILADSRTIDSRDRVNEFVKHREEWRPFAPSMLEEAAEDYLVDAEAAPYMIKTFDVKEEKRAEIPAVLHPADDTTRPQTVCAEQNPRYHALLQEFDQITGVPVILNTSFNDSGEPIVNTPVEAIKDFYSMGLDTLVIENLVLEKPAGRKAN
jgi:carbamoyltransferase